MVDATTDNNVMIGIGTSLAALTLPGIDAEGYGYYGLDGTGFYNSAFTAVGDAYTATDVIGVAIDLTAGKIWWSKNGAWQDGGDPASGTNESYSGVSGTFFPMAGLYALNSKCTIQIEVGDLSYTPPTGFSVLC